MTPPTLDFVGIAAPRSGTTWLRAMLRTHSEIYVPVSRKEPHYFDRYYERGPAWYGRFFEDVDPSVHRVIGEITPHYLFSELAPTRIEAAGIPRLVMVLRDPVDRIISHHRFRQQVDGYAGTLGEFVRDYPRAAVWSDYASGLERYLERFELSQFLILLFEHVRADPTTQLERVGRFLEVDPARFDPSAVDARDRNPSQVPRNRRVYAAAHRTAAWLRERDIYWLPNLVRRTPLRRQLVRADAASAAPPPDPEVVAELRGRFGSSVRRLGELTGMDLSAWATRP